MRAGLATMVVLLALLLAALLAFESSRDPDPEPEPSGAALGRAPGAAGDSTVRGGAAVPESNVAGGSVAAGGQEDGEPSGEREVLRGVVRKPSVASPQGPVVVPEPDPSDRNYRGAGAAVVSGRIVPPPVETWNRVEVYAIAPEEIPEFILSWSSDFGYSTRVDETGCFELGVAPGRYRLVVPPEMFKAGSDPLDERYTVDLEPGARREGLEIAVRRGSTVRGTVRDERGSPLPYYKVEAFSTRRYQRSDSTDESGSYVLAGLAPGRYRIRPREGGGDAVELDLDGQGERTLDFTVPGGGVRHVRGTVAVPDGDNIRVVLITGDGFPRIAYLDEDGTFTLPACPATTLLLIAQDGRRVVGALELTPGREDLDVVIPADGAAVVEGRVLDGAGEPVEGARLSCSLEDYPVGGSLAATGADGRFRFEGQPPGKLRLWAGAEGRTDQELRLTIRPGQVADDVVLRCLRRRGVSVLVRGAPVGTELVVLAWVSTHGRHVRQVVSPGQVETVDDLVEGEWWLRAVAGRGRGAWGATARVRVQADGPEPLVELDLQPCGSIAGRVEVPTAPEALERTVMFLPEGLEHPFDWVHAAADGRFLLDEIPPGRYRLRVLDATRPAERVVEVQPGGAIEGLAIPGGG